MTDTKVFPYGACTLVGNLVFALGTWKYGGWGSGTTPAAKSATACEDEEAETATTKVTGTLTQNTVDATHDQIQVVATITALAGKTISNFGVFNATTAGVMVFYATFSGVVLSANDGIQFTALTQFT